MEKPFILICAWCQKEHPDVNAAVKKEAPLQRVTFSHGICPRHFVAQCRDMGLPEEKIQADLEKMKRSGNKSSPDLAQHPELIQAYSEGNFLPPQQGLRERFQKLANIKK
jgi:hypothetical protein